MVSEANIEYAGTSLLESFSSWPENLIVVRSFSKVHGLAGLRVGFGVAEPNIINEIMKFQLPFGVSHLSQVAAIAALADKKHVKRSVLSMRDEKDFLCKQLEMLNFEILSTDSNILLAKLPPYISGGKDFIATLEGRDITVLSGGAFSPLLNEWIRISPRAHSTNVAFVDGVQKALAEYNHNL